MISIELVGGPFCGETRALNVSAPPPDYQIKQGDIEVNDWATGVGHPAPVTWTKLVYRRARAKPGGLYVYEFDPNMST